MKKLEAGGGEIADLVKMLAKVDFLAPLSIGQMEQVLPFIRLYSCDAGETVFKQGGVGDAFYIVYSGGVEVRVKKNWLSPSTVAAFLDPGDFFGEMALISRDRRTATVRCVEATRLFALSAKDFEFILRQSPGAAETMRRIAAERRFDLKNKTA
jgi:signal-transduction protein with cAMP-binding, CBS, and nucleotidyltransferase domain